MRSHWLPALALLATGGLHPRLATAADVSITKTSDAVEFKAGPTVVARYHVGQAVAKPYLWPVLAPGNVPVTRTWPIEKGAPGDATTDHPHQKSAWFCHGDVIPEGIELKTKSANKGDHGVDFWSEAKDKDGKPRHGTIKNVKSAIPAAPGAGTITITTWNEWIS